jgi:hypothetical protein
MQELTEVTLASDGYLPCRDNVEHAAEVGIKTTIEPGGSIRTPQNLQAARELGVRHVQTGLRLFHYGRVASAARALIPDRIGDEVRQRQASRGLAALQSRSSPVRS